MHKLYVFASFISLYGISPGDGYISVLLFPPFRLKLVLRLKPAVQGTKNSLQMSSM